MWLRMTTSCCSWIPTSPTCFFDVGVRREPFNMMKLSDKVISVLCLCSKWLFTPSKRRILALRKPRIPLVIQLPTIRACPKLVGHALVVLPDDGSRNAYPRYVCVVGWWCGRRQASRATTRVLILVGYFNTGNSSVATCAADCKLYATGFACPCRTIKCATIYSYCI